MVDILNRDLAPIPAEAWEFLDEEAREVLENRLGGRRVVEVTGPHGLEKSAINTGRSEELTGAFTRRKSLPMFEIEIPITMPRAEIEAFVRGAEDADSDPVREAAERAARIENEAIFKGHDEANIEGIISASEHEAIEIEEDRSSFFSAIWNARKALNLENVPGPYILVLGDRHYQLLNELESACYPLFKKIEDLLGTEIVYVPELEDQGVLISAGDDYQLHLGQDLSLGYKNSDQEKLELFLFESFTFQVHAPEAAVVLE